MGTAQQITAKTLSVRHARPTGNEALRIRNTTFRGFLAANILEANRLYPKCAKTGKVKTRNEVNLTRENYLAEPTPVPVRREVGKTSGLTSWRQVRGFKKWLPRWEH
jgi:hypothetical protein